MQTVVLNVTQDGFELLLLFVGVVLPFDGLNIEVFGFGAFGYGSFTAFTITALWILITVIFQIKKNEINLKVYDPITFGLIYQNGVFCIRLKVSYFLITTL